MKYALKSKLDQQIFLELEKGIPICQKPFQAIAEKFNQSEGYIFKEIDKYKSKNLIRRFGSVFNSNLLGYQSCLCSASIDCSSIKEISLFVQNIPNITHCYLRDHSINLWFTFSEIKDCFEDSFSRVERFFAPIKVNRLPAINKFKISVIFDMGLSSSKSVIDHTPEVEIKNISNKEKSLIRALKDFPLTSMPFDTISKITKIDIVTLMQTLSLWQKNKALKRIGIIPYHYNLGYRANIMCAWKVDHNKIERIGKEVAMNSNVSHCYERETCPGFSYNFYAMLHTPSLKEAMRVFEQISKQFSLDEGIPLLSTREIKKTSLELFPA